MAIVEAALVDRLKNDAGVAAYTGARIRRLRLRQQDTLPALTFQKISRVPLHLMGGDDPLEWARFQLDSWAENDADVTGLSEAVLTCLRGWSGTAAGVTVQRIFFEGEEDSYEPDTRRLRVSQDFIVWWETS